MELWKHGKLPKILESKYIKELRNLGWSLIFHQGFEERGEPQAKKQKAHGSRSGILKHLKKKLGNNISSMRLLMSRIEEGVIWLI